MYLLLRCTLTTARYSRLTLFTVTITLDKQCFDSIVTFKMKLTFHTGLQKKGVSHIDLEMIKSFPEASSTHSLF